MKIMLKWAGIFVIPSILFFLYIQSDFSSRSDELKALFFVFHFLFTGVAIYFTLVELKKKSIETVSALRYIITGILTSVTYALLFALVSATYFNFVDPEAKERFISEQLEPALIRGFDSTANTREEYFDHLMEGKDSGVLLPERYAEYRQAALDSLARLDEVIEKVEYQNFSFRGTIIKWVGFAPIIGILFSVIVTVFVTKR